MKIYMVIEYYDYEPPTSLEAFESLVDAEEFRCERISYAYNEGLGPYVNYRIKEVEVRPDSSKKEG